MGQQDEGESKGSRRRLGALGVTISAAIASLPTAANADLQKSQSQVKEFDHNQGFSETTPETSRPFIIADATDDPKQGFKPAEKKPDPDGSSALTNPHDNPPWRQNYYWWRNAWGNW